MIDNRTRRSNRFYRRFPFLKSRKLQNKFNEMYFQHFKTYPLNVSFIKWVYLIVNLCGIYIVSYFLWPFWQKIFLVVIEFIHLNLFFFEGPSCVDELSHKEFYWNTKMFFAGLLWKNFHIGWDFYTIYIQYEWSICSPFLSVSKQSRHAHIMYIESVIGRYNCSSSLCWLWRGPLLKRFQCKWWRTGGTTTVTNKMCIMWVFKVVDQWL